MSTTLTVKALKNYINSELNIIISGVHGVGKTAKLKEACNQLGKTVKYYSAATLDPYTDLVGIPVPNQEAKTVEYFRPHAIDKAEVIFFDEINRADPKTLNTIMEIILDHSINGEPLPKLMCVVAAMNPVTADYATDELDKALLDRFDVFLQADPEVDVAYFVNKFGDKMGAAAVAFWNEYHTSYTASRNASAANAVPYLSPRRMDKIVGAFLALPARQTVVDCLPPEVTDASVASNLYRALNKAMEVEKAPVSGITADVQAITNSSIANQRTPAVGAKAKELLESGQLEDGDKARLLTSLAVSLNSSKGVPALVEQFGTALKAMTATQFKTLTDGWGPAKLADLQRRLALN